MKISIVTGRIKGFRRPSYIYCGRYKWKITFLESSNPIITSSDVLVDLGESKEVARISRRQIVKNFRNALIFEADMVVGVFDENRNLIAIAKNFEEVWLDATDGFKPKTFGAMNIDITSLQVFAYDYWLLS